MNAYDVLIRLQGSGLTIPRISAITGVGKSTLYAIQNGSRSGETVLPTLLQLLEARGSHASPSIGLGPRSPMIVERTRSQLPVRYQEPMPQNNAWELTPQRMMQEIQATRMEVQELKHLLLQQNKRPVSQEEQYQELGVFLGEGLARLFSGNRKAEKQPQRQLEQPQRVTSPIPQTMRQIASGNASPLTKEQANIERLRNQMR